MKQNTLRGLVAVGSLVAVGAANAALDITAATSSVSDAQTALLAVLAVILTMTAGVWALKKVVRLFGN